MSVQRRVNWISQQRVDVPDMRALESAASNDFDQLIQAFVTGTTQGYILRGFELSMAGAIGGAASGLQLIVDPGAVMHVTSSQSGTTYLVPTGTQSQQLNSATNPIVDGAFAPSAINYVSLEYERFIDDTTSAQVYLWDPTTKSETTKNAPRAQILRYRIRITTATPAANYLPIAEVITDSGNNVISITDARWRLTRLGQGGFNPNPFYEYPWTAQSEGRTENPSTSSSNAVNPFHGGDKMLGDLKAWMDAIMSALKEIKGTTYWYSQSSSGSLESLREDLGNTIITGRGHIAHSKTTAGLINWDQDINVRVIGSSLTYTLLANPSSTDVTLADDKVAYITLIRGVTILPNLVFTNGQPIVSSVGAISWTGPLEAGDWLKLGADTDAGYYQIQSVDSLTQVTLTTAYSGASTGAGGAKSKYAFGSYQASPTPSTSRDIYIANRSSVPAGEDVFWLFARSDNGGSIPRVYIRFLGSELQQGETEEISDNTPLELLQYIGSPIESAYAPQYASALNPGSVPQITDFTVGAASTISSNQYFLMSSSGNYRKYYVWFNKDGAGSDPMAPGTNGSIEVDITSGQTAAQVATILASAINGNTPADFAAVQRPTPNTNIVRVTNASAGSTAAATNFNVSSPFAVTTIQSGTGTGNIFIEDGDNLTLAIKKLDQAIANLTSSLDEPSYDESIDVVASGATPPSSITGPIAPGTTISLPNNSRESSAVQRYTVGQGVLQVYLNGQYLRLGIDWAEVGVAATASNSFVINNALAVGDTITLRMSGAGSGAGGGGSGGVGPQGPPGPAGPSGTDAVGGPVAITTKNSNYTVTLSNNVLLANCASNSVTFSLPKASTAIGYVFFFKKIDTSVNGMVIQAFAGDLIDGLSSQSTTTQWESFQLITDGVNWYVF